MAHPKNETPNPSYSRSVELTLRLDVLGYMKEKRVRNDKVHYTLVHAKDGVRHIGDIEEGFVMKMMPSVSVDIASCDTNRGRLPFLTSNWKT